MLGNEGFDLFDLAQGHVLAPPDAQQKFGVLRSLSAQPAVRAARGGFKGVNSAEKVIACFHGCNIGYLRTPVKHYCTRDGFFDSPYLLSMTVLGKLIKDSLDKADVKMAQASRRAGQSSGYVKALVAGRIENPGILTLLAVAEAAGVDMSAVIEAVKADRGVSKMTKEEQALLDLYRRASRAEKARMFPETPAADKRPKGRRNR